MSYETLSETEWEKVDRIWALLDRSQTEAARLELRGLQGQRPGHPDLRIVDAALSLDEGEPTRALDSLKGAERSADPALFFHLRAIAHFELAHFEQSRDDAERALAIRPDLADTHDLLSRVFEHLHQLDSAAEHASEARSLDAQAFPGPLEVGDEEFDAIVEKCVGELPAKVRDELENLPVVVEPLPSRAMLTSENPPLTPDLLGLFIGRSRLERSSADLPETPGSIHLFRRNLLRIASDREELAKEIRTTVLHEVGHLLGLDEDDLERWGLA